MGNKLKSRYKIYIEAAARLALLNGVANTEESILITEFPKSGGTWLGQMISGATKLNFPRNQIPTQRKIVFHGHYLKPYKIKKIIVLWRDPRDLIVSWYYHSIIGNQHSNDNFVKKSREKLIVSEYSNIQSSMTAFIDMIFTDPLSPKFTWNDFFDAWHGDSKVIETKYETLRADPLGELSKIMASLGFPYDEELLKTIIEEYSFQNQSGRKSGSENKKSFLRKGVVGDWKNVFSDEAEEKLYSYVGSRMTKLGYR